MYEHVSRVDGWTTSTSEESRLGSQGSLSRNGDETADEAQSVDGDGVNVQAGGNRCVVGKQRAWSERVCRYNERNATGP
jgi:hypothetical protein